MAESAEGNKNTNRLFRGVRMTVWGASPQNECPVYLSLEKRRLARGGAIALAEPPGLPRTNVINRLVVRACGLLNLDHSAGVRLPVRALSD